MLVGRLAGHRDPKAPRSEEVNGSLRGAQNQTLIKKPSSHFPWTRDYGLGLGTSSSFKTMLLSLVAHKRLVDIYIYIYLKASPLPPAPLVAEIRKRCD